MKTATYYQTAATALMLIALSTFSSLAQQTRLYEEKGGELLRAASTKIKSFNTLKIEFSYEMDNSRQDIQERMDGTLFSQGDKFRMVVGENQFISDGKTLWMYMEELDEVHINTVDNADMSLTPTAILDEFDTSYKSTFIKQEQHQGKLVDIIDLVPNQPQAFFKYRVALDAQTSMMAYATAFDRHGGTYTYQIKRIQPNLTLPANTFSFSASDFPGVEIIDLR